MVRFWNNIAAMRPDSLHYKVLMRDIRLAIVEGRETFSGTLMQLGYYMADHVRFDRALQIDISHVKDLCERLWAVEHLCPQFISLAINSMLALLCLLAPL
jgi:hypothetical protein